MDFGSYALAKDIKKTVEKIATDKVDQLRPALRTAIVDEINTTDKYCMVTYVGESLSVKVPYNNVAPSYVGQYVRVGGPANDRRIEEVLGVTDSEDRLAQLEARAAHLELKAYATASLTADWPIPNGAPALVPFNNAIWILPLNVTMDSLGVFTIQIPGDYRYDVNIQTTGHSNTQFDTYIYKTSADYTGDLQRAASVYLQGSGEYNETNPVAMNGLVHMNEGDTLRINLGGNASSASALMYGCRFSIELINPDPIVRPS